MAQTPIIIPILQLIVSAIGLLSLFLIWHQIKLNTKWNQFKAHHDLLGYLPDGSQELETLKALKAVGCERNSKISRQMAIGLYDDDAYFITIKSFLNKYEHFCSAVNMGAIDEEHAYSLHSGRVVNVFYLYGEYITVTREHRGSNSPYIELQSVAVRWKERRAKQENTLKAGIENLTMAAEKTSRPVFK